MTFATFLPSRAEARCGLPPRAFGVNHATVLRRIAQLEERLGALMFEKLPAGYRLTAAGEEVLDLAEQMDTSCDGQRSSRSGGSRVVCRNTRVSHSQR